MKIFTKQSLDKLQEEVEKRRKEAAKFYPYG